MTVPSGQNTIEKQKIQNSIRINKNKPSKPTSKPSESELQSLPISSKNASSIKWSKASRLSWLKHSSVKYLIISVKSGNRACSLENDVSQQKSHGISMILNVVLRTPEVLKWQGFTRILKHHISTLQPLPPLPPLYPTSCSMRQRASTPWISLEGSILIWKDSINLEALIKSMLLVIESNTCQLGITTHWLMCL